MLSVVNTIIIIMKLCRIKKKKKKMTFRGEIEIVDSLKTF